MVYLHLLAGLALLLASGEFLVRGAVAVATRLGVSPLFIGLTLVGFGTSAPELVASVIAALEGSPGIAIGNVIGSNIANVLLILGIAAVVRVLPVSEGAYRRDAWVMLCAILLLVAAALIGGIDRFAGAIFLALLIGYVAVTYRIERRAADSGAAMHEAEAESHSAPPGWSLRFAAAVTIASLTGVMGGAALLVESSIELARTLGITETVIGLTMVAVGTSLPELVVSAIAAARGQGAVAIGNILGSNLYNVLCILGVTALVRPIAMPEEVLRYDVWVMLGSALALMAFILKGRSIGRPAGLAFLAVYGVYVASIVL